MGGGGHMCDGRILVGESSIGTMSAVSQASRVFYQGWQEAKGNILFFSLTCLENDERKIRLCS